MTVPAQRRTRNTQSPRVTGNTSKLLDAITEHIADRYSGLTDNEYLILAIWVIHSYFYQESSKTVYLHIASLASNAGKTTLAKILADLCYEAQRLLPTVAALGQFHESGKHTLIIDQLDTLISSRNFDVEMLWTLLGSGNEPGTDWRVSGQPDRDMYFPKILVGIGPGILTTAIAERSIRIMARPGTEADQTERERRQAIRPVAETAEMLRYRLSRLAASTDIRSAIRAGSGPVTAGTVSAIMHTRTLNDGTRLSNRASDIWQVMICIADAMGADYGKRMRDIAAQYSGTEPEYLPSMAEQIDAKLRALMREGKLTAINWASGKEPLGEHQDKYPLSNADFGYPAPRNGQRGRLPVISLKLIAAEHKADLRIKAGSDFKEICTALNMQSRDVRAAYAEAIGKTSNGARLHVQSGRASIPTPFRQGQGDTSLVVIDISGWLWPATETESK
jgi:hypothetical protein